MKKACLISFLVSALILTSLAGCSQPHAQESPSTPRLTYMLGSDDWSVLTKLQASAEVIEAYQFAVEHPEVLDYMPCYCGCYEHDGHIGNTDCFVQSIDGNTAVLDSMGLA